MRLRLPNLQQPTRAEASFIRLMGGRVWRLPVTGRLMIITLGKTLRDNHFRRRVPVGNVPVAFGNDLQWAIELDGLRYHDDTKIKRLRDEFFEDYGWRVLHVPDTKIRHSPAKVRAQVLEFLNA